MEEEKRLLSVISTVFWSFIFLGIGLGMGLFLIYSGGLSLYQKWHWNEYKNTDAEVTNWYVSSSTHTGVAYGVAKTSVSYGVGCEYIYYDGDKKYSGYGQTESADSKEEAQLAVNRHHTGEAIPIWFHPDSPDIPVIENQIPRTGNSIWFIILGTIIVLFLINLSVSAIKDKLTGSEIPE